MNHSSELHIDRLGLRAAAVLNSATDALPHAVTERLRVARMQALSRRKRAATQAAPVLLHAGPVAALGGGPRQRWRQTLVLALPALVLFAGLVLIDGFQKQRLADDLAVIDTAVLLDELPPAAYTDPGFAQFLKTSQESDGQ